MPSSGLLLELSDTFTSRMEPGSQPQLRPHGHNIEQVRLQDHDALTSNTGYPTKSHRAPLPELRAPGPTTPGCCILQAMQSPGHPGDSNSIFCQCLLWKSCKEQTSALKSLPRQCPQLQQEKARKGMLVSRKTANLHESCKGLGALNWHGVVHRGSHATHRSMPLQLDLHIHF